MWPRAFSTLGRLKRLKSDIFEAVRSSLGATVGVAVGAGRASASRRLAVERLKRHRDVVEDSDVRLRMLLAGLSRDFSSGAMVPECAVGEGWGLGRLSMPHGYAGGWFGGKARGDQRMKTAWCLAKEGVDGEGIVSGSGERLGKVVRRSPGCRGT